MQESASSAPGSHFGVCKALAVEAKLPCSHANHFSALAQVFAVMMLLPLLHEFSPCHWCSCVNAVLEKIPGPAMESCRCCRAWAWATQAECIMDTLTWKQTSVAIPMINLEAVTAAVAADIAAAVGAKGAPAVQPLLQFSAPQ